MKAEPHGNGLPQTIETLWLLTTGNMARTGSARWPVGKVSDGNPLDYFKKDITPSLMDAMASRLSYRRD